jgi:hypothetical protein
MKLSDDQKQRIETRWKNYWEGVTQAQHQILNWLFTMNTGGVAGVLAYAAAKSAGPAIITALVLFSTGLLCLIGHAACMYYAEVNAHRGYRKDLSEYYAEKISWDEFQGRDAKRPDRHPICEVLAWTSAVFGGLGIVLSAFAIL